MTTRVVIVRHVPAIRRNILSGPNLLRKGFRLDCKCNKVVILHLSSGCYYSKCYLCNVDNLFKLRVKHSNYVNVNASSSHFVAFNIEFSNMCHEHLGHVNFNSLKHMMNLNIFPKFAINRKNKYEIFV